MDIAMCPTYLHLSWTSECSSFLRWKGRGRTGKQSGYEREDWCFQLAGWSSFIREPQLEEEVPVVSRCSRQCEIILTNEWFRKGLPQCVTFGDVKIISLCSRIGVCACRQYVQFIRESNYTRGEEGRSAPKKKLLFNTKETTCDTHIFLFSEVLACFFHSIHQFIVLPCDHLHVSSWSTSLRPRFNITSRVP